jgi:hypothetical protein
MGRCFYPHLFDADVFAGEVDAATVAVLERWASDGVECAGLTGEQREVVDDVVAALGMASATLDDGALRALDEEFDISSRRFIAEGLPFRRSHCPDLAGHVQEGVWASGDGPAVDELCALLDHINGIDGGRFGDLAEPFVGYLLPGEIRRAGALLEGHRFTDPAQEDDRRLLLEIFSISGRNGHGLYWTWL